MAATVDATIKTADAVTAKSVMVAANNTNLIKTELSKAGITAEPVVQANYHGRFHWTVDQSCSSLFQF